MKAGSRPQYYRIRRMVQMVREGTGTGYLPNSSDFMKEFEVSRRTVARDLDFLRDDHAGNRHIRESLRHANATTGVSDLLSCSLSQVGQPTGRLRHCHYWAE